MTFNILMMASFVISLMITYVFERFLWAFFIPPLAIILFFLGLGVYHEALGAGLGMGIGMAYYIGLASGAGTLLGIALKKLLAARLKKRYRNKRENKNSP
ncbi:hypothetical protein [Nitrosococcus watsonii]|uniref:Uncharacterized protein n=1 Tax=Nitrosococcus watsoni (strain C-113) TaxID=105559 RepID=D8K5U6_NITWC|nr:hypothetical protein [Nitrosococcus watsonii]ADJ28273.1 conserved hypothetical protein [Nitrosococcus watsonii C-113]